MMMSDPDIHHFLFLGSYRDNEVDKTHPLTTQLHAIRQQGTIIVPITIGPIEKECVNTLLSEVLCEPPSLCRSLSTIVHSKTSGIILFILRFLASLNDEGDIWFNKSSGRWMCDLNKIRRKEIHGDVVSHMTEQMFSLSRKMRIGLKMAACLGRTFDGDVFKRTKKGDEIEDTFLETCADLGFVQKHGSDQYVWAHDQIQQAAHDLIPPSKRTSFHLLIGSRLFLNSSKSESMSTIFVIVDNMNRGIELIDDAEQKFELSQLNLEAGDRAMAASAFQSAAKYLLTGISLLGPGSWDNDKYSLTMRLYDMASEALYVTGDYSKLSELMIQPLTKARSFEDKLNIQNNLVRALSASYKFEEGIANCVSILDQLGEKIPTDNITEVFPNEAAEVKKLLHGKSHKDLLSLPVMCNASKLATMQFLNHIFIMTSIAQPALYPIITFRMVKMSILHGICNNSPFAFASYGAWLVGEPSNDVEGGHKLGCVALEMMTRLGAYEAIPRVYMCVYGSINILAEPWQAGLDKHLEAYESGVTTGDMEYAILNLATYVNKATFCGNNLDSLSVSIQAYAKRANQCNQRGLWISLLVFHQLALDLMGTDQNAFLPLSNVMTEDLCLESSRIKNAHLISRLICNKKKYIAFYKGDLETAAKMYDLSLEFPTGAHGRLVSAIVSAFIDGLIGFFFARKQESDAPRWAKIGQDVTTSFRKWAKHSDWNFSNKLYLLEAENYFLFQDDDRAITCYRASIKAARAHRFVHEEGLAEEKLATFFLRKNGHSDALKHFINAKVCYEVWGAHTLVQRVEKAIDMLSTLAAHQ